MKSGAADLERRGQYIPSGGEGKRINEIDALLGSGEAWERTLGALLVGVNALEKYVPALIDLLKKERALYTRMGICEALALFPSAVPLLLGQIGQIGSNRLTKLPEKAFEKKSYPLPRDICARTLIRMDGKMVLRACVDALSAKGEDGGSEIIDIIGHISFFGKNDDAYPRIRSAIFDRLANETLRYKYAIMLRSFGTDESMGDDLSLQKTETKGIILAELKRSREIASSRLR